MSQRRDCTPVLVQRGGRAVLLSRIPFTERRLQEGWLQELLFEYPSILPVADLDPGFAPLLPLGREIPTQAGPIDVLYVSPTGLLTIVEAKLWRNPEARREVVGQIIDYAKELASWAYEDLDAAVRTAMGKGLWEIVSREVFDGDPNGESAFVDRVSRNLREGRFLLLIAGDGLHDSVENMVSFLQGTPQLQFTLALVELQLYGMGNNEDILVVPQVIARTVEVTRAVVRVESAGPVQSISVKVDVPDDDKAKTQRRTISRDEFIGELGTRLSGEQVRFLEHLLDYLPSLGLKVTWGTSGCSFRLPDPGGSRQLLTTLVIDRSGVVYVAWLSAQLSRIGLPVELGLRYVEEGARVLGRRVRDGYPDMWDRAADILTLMRNFDEFAEVLKRFIDGVRAASATRIPETNSSTIANCAIPMGGTCRDVNWAEGAGCKRQSGISPPRRPDS
ncbi:MAG: hypothetical protein GX492_11445 [Firmicutes bacterium]|nr:hypothetical protein [Bacillota bacterium]HHY33974.1 hypothetical protein [Bacillota bacterium]